MYYKFLFNLLKPLALRNYKHCLSFSLWSAMASLTNDKEEIQCSSEEKNESKLVKPRLYWTSKSIDDLLSDADYLFNRGQFMEVYELLNRLKFNQNVECQWRISRALFKLSQDKSIDYGVRKEMITEAYDLITSCIKLDENNANVYKWMAIILDEKLSYISIETRVKEFDNVKEYLLKAIELNPQDETSCYILGKFCFEMRNLSLIQRFIGRILYGEIPTSSYEEAYEYLNRAYEINPETYYIPNLYLLGKTCFYLKQFYRARFFLRTATLLPPRTKQEEIYAAKAKAFLEKLDKYDLMKETVLFDFDVEL